MRKYVLALLVVLASVWLLWLVDDGLEFGWSSVVLHNWRQFGLTALHGSLVDNPGGFEALSRPHVYYGMSPWFLYPVYFCASLFAWTGLGALPFHLVLTIFVLAGIWHLLGKNTSALLVAALVVLSPGYGRWQKLLDPNAVSVLMGFPYAALVTHLLKQPQPRFKHGAALGLLTVMFIPLNWTTAWFLTPFGVFLLLYPEVRRRSVLIFLTLAAAGAVLFVGLSVHAKAGGNAPASSGGFLGGYTWGAYGYYEGLSTLRTMFRVFFVVVAALLPFLFWWGLKTAQCFLKSPRRAGTSLLPLAAAVAEVMIMRNYFGHHPWMAAPVVMVGLVFSLVLQTTSVETSEILGHEWKWLPVATACALLYGLAVIAVFRANNRENLALAHLVREHVARTNDVAVVTTLDPATAGLSNSLAAQFDRHFIIVDTLNDLPLDPSLVILSSQPATNLQLVAETPQSATATWTAKAAHWFNRNVARRKPGDRIEFAENYYLYQRPP